MNFKRLPFYLIALLFLLHPVQAGDAEDIMRLIKAGDIFEIVKILSSPEMDGRLSGTEGYNRAARWAAAKFKDLTFTGCMG